MKNKSIVLTTICLLATVLGVSFLSLDAKSAADKKFGAPTEGMSTEDYQALVFLDPQNTVRMDWDAVRGMKGNFLRTQLSWRTQRHVQPG